MVIGVAYKRNVGDIRESPALDIIRLLRQQGAEVRYHDPFVPRIHEDGRTDNSVELTTEEVSGADCVVLATDHTNLDYDMLRSEAKGIVDTRNALKRRA